MNARLPEVRSYVHVHVAWMLYSMCHMVLFAVAVLAFFYVCTECLVFL
jgi:hypothetical protein